MAPPSVCSKVDSEVYGGATSPRCQQRLFLTMSPSREDQQATMHRQDTIVKIPESRCVAEASPWTTETKRIELEE